MLITVLLLVASVSALTADELFNQYSVIFPHGNRNAASHRWATYVLDRALNFTEQEVKYLFANFCPVSGSPLGDNRMDSSRWKLTLPDLHENEYEGFVHFCCWPCVCDAHDWLRVDRTEIETAEGKRSFNFLVIGNPCTNEVSIPSQATDVTCSGGQLEKATLSQNGFPIVGLLQDFNPMNQFQDEALVLDSECSARASDGYHSGMGQIFREVAMINTPSAGTMEKALAQNLCDAGSAASEYQQLEALVRENPVVLASAVYQGSSHYRCSLAAEQKLQGDGVCFEEVDISDTLWAYLQCLYPDEKTNGRMMHSYLFIGGTMVGNGFVVDERMDPRYSWNQLRDMMTEAGAEFSCHDNCDSLIDSATKAELDRAIVTQPVVMYGWDSCPCVSTARSRFASKHVCFIENIWTDPENAKMKYLQCVYGHEHHSFIWFNQKNADGTMGGGQFIGNGFFLEPDTMSNTRFESLLERSGARRECQGLEDQSLLGGQLEACTDENDQTTTGFTRSGSCVWQPSDRGYHQVCVRMSNQFITQSAIIDKNDLSSVTEEGQHWCICAWAWASISTRDPENFEGIHLECGRTNQRLREVYQTYIDSGNDICSPGGVCYKARAALDAVNRLCPEQEQPVNGKRAASLQSKHQQQTLQQDEVKPISPKNAYYYEPIVAFSFAILITFGMCYFIQRKSSGRRGEFIPLGSESVTLKTC